MNIKELIEELIKIEDKERRACISRSCSFPFAVSTIDEIQISPTPIGPVYFRSYEK
jgi:hypothetical protein